MHKPFGGRAVGEAGAPRGSRDSEVGDSEVGDRVGELRGWRRAD